MAGSKLTLFPRPTATQASKFLFFSPFAEENALELAGMLLLGLLTQSWSLFKAYSNNILEICLPDFKLPKLIQGFLWLLILKLLKLLQDIFYAYSGNSAPSNFVFCSIFCLFLPYSCLIPGLFLSYFSTFAFWSIFCLFLPYSWLIPVLFLEFRFLKHILLIPALFLASSCLLSRILLSEAYSTYSCLYSCLIPVLFLEFCFLKHILLIPALFLA